MRIHSVIVKLKQIIDWAEKLLWLIVPIQEPAFAEQF